MIKNKKLKGITMVEVITYVALFGLIFVGVLQFVISTNKNNNVARQRTVIERSSSFILKHIGNSFNNITSINEDLSVFDNDNSKLVFNDNLEEREYLVLDDKLMFKNVELFDITNNNISVDKFIINKVIQNDELIGVRITINFSSLNELSVEKEITSMFLL